MKPDEIEPFKKVLKDGFMLVDCVKDSMYESGDKFGDNRHGYKMGDISGVSIVHYTSHVPKEDRKKMTHAVCFEFCRTVPDMGFFGISNGRDCYCTPYYKPAASDSSECDAVCEGDNTQMCGGKSKNSLFSMHLCADTEADLSTSIEEATELKASINKLLVKIETAANDGEAEANTLQKSFGTVGDPVASDLMQSAKVWAGELLDEAKDGTKFANGLEDVIVKAEDLKGGDFEDYETIKKAERGVTKMNVGVSEGETIQSKLEEMLELVSPEVEKDRAAEAAKQYLPIMHFVDKEFEDVPSTCGGDAVDKPIFGKSKDECAVACDSQVGECVGFAYFEKDSGICFLFSKFTSAQYYTGCKKSFLQANLFKEPFTASCLAKTQYFESTTLKPDPSGKCKRCLKETTNAKRCFK